MNRDVGAASILVLNGRRVGHGEPCYIIAEIGGNFNGSMDLALRSIDAAADCGADAVKFQTYNAEDLVSDPGLTYTYTEGNGRTVTVSQLEMFRRMELPAEWHEKLRDHAHSREVEFLSSAADVDAVDLLTKLDVPAIKISSEDLINVPVVERAAAAGRAAIISTGMADEEEILQALHYFEKQENPEIILLHCTSTYPTPPEACNIRRIDALRARFQVPVGFSDHTEGWLAPVLAVAAGACVVEKHFTLDRTLPGPDHSMSADPATFKEMVRRIREAEEYLGQERVRYDETEEAAREEFRRSIVARRVITEGETITEEMLAYRRPGYGLKPAQRDLVIGRRVQTTIKTNERICEAQLEPSSTPSGSD